MTMDVYSGRKTLEVLLNECVVKLDYEIEIDESKDKSKVTRENEYKK